MNPNKLLLWLHCVLAACLIGLVIPYAWFGWPTARSLKESAAATSTTSQQLPKLIASATAMTTELTKDSKEIALDIHRDVVVAGVTESETQKLVTLLRSETPTFLNQGHATLTNANALLSASTLTVTDAQKLIVEFSTVPAHINQLADNTAEAVDSTNRFITDPATADLRDNATLAISNLGKLALTSNKMVGDFDARYLAPWDHSHPVRHYFGIIGKTAIDLTGIGATLVRDTK